MSEFGAEIFSCWRYAFWIVLSGKKYVISWLSLDSQENTFSKFKHIRDGQGRRLHQPIQSAVGVIYSRARVVSRILEIPLYLSCPG